MLPAVKVTPFNKNLCEKLQETVDKIQKYIVAQRISFNQQTFQRSR